MDNTELPINDFSHMTGEEMSYITFKELVMELTGSSFEEVYKNYKIYGENDDQGYMG